MDDKERYTQVKQLFVEAYGQPPALWVQAPGRVDLMGSHTDYNEGYVLTMSINRSTWIAARPRTDRKVALCSANVPGCVTFDLDDIRRDEAVPWTNYVKGVAATLQAARYPLIGFDGLIHSTVPFSSGLSSSAALEIATAVLFRALSGWPLDPVEMARLCQRAENQFVGVNCGILDQYTSAMGQAGHAVLLDCRHLTSEIVPIHPGIQVVICDTQAKRELTGCEYDERRAQCEDAAARMAAIVPGVKTLRDVTLAQLIEHDSDLPDVVARRARFIIEENQRVIALADALTNGDTHRIRYLCAESFAGACHLYEIGIPAMHTMMTAMLSGPGVIGARQAGAGFGGCMVAFVERDCVPAFAAHVEARYQATSGIAPKVYPVFAAPGGGVLGN